MRITDLTTVDPQYKKHRRAETLSETIQKRLDYHIKNNPSKLPMHAPRRAHELIENLKIYISSPRLDRDEFISHTPFGPMGLLLSRPVKEVLEYVFTGMPEPGKAQHTGLTLSLVEQMNELGRAQRAKRHRSLLSYEIAYRYAQGWYILFNTLTVAPGEYYKVFNERSTAFQDYIRHIDRAVAQSSYGSIRLAKGQDYHSYFAVVEEGGKHGRLHIHVIHFCKTLPKGSRDPNYELAVPTRRELNTFKAHWKHGFSSPIMVRVSPKDAFGLAGYRWPLDLRTNAPLLIKSPLALASYMSKYITKSYSSPARDKWLWRIRKTQKLGWQIPLLLTSTLTSAELLAVATDPSLNLKLNNQRVPGPILRQAALKNYQSLSQGTLSPLKSLLEMGKQLEPMDGLLQSLRGLTPKTRMFNPQSSTIISTLLMQNIDVFEDAWKSLKRQAKVINGKYFPTSTYAYGTASTKDHLFSTSNAPTKAN